MNTTKTFTRGAVALALLLAFHSQATAQIALWTFETSIPATAGPHAAEVGTGSATGFHTSGAVVYSNPAGNGSVESFSANTWTTVGDYYQFQTSTLGYTGVIVSWDQTRSATGPATFDLQYSTDGTNFTTFLNDYLVGTLTWSTGAGRQSGSTFSQDLSSITALDNQPNVWFRLTSEVTAAAAGTNRVDNFAVIPEPTSMTLACVGVACFAAKRLRRRKAAQA